MQTPDRGIFRRVNVLFLLLFVAAGLSGLRAYGQSGAGSIQGTVKDATGAVIPNAQIHVVNTATRVATDTKSNGAGFFQVPELFTGHYAMTVTVPDMKTYATSVQLLVAQNAVIDPVLVAGSVSQRVEVNANTEQLTTKDSPAIESTLENARIQQLPENGRQLTTLLNLTVPGLENTGSNVNGLDPEAFDYIVDGAPTRNNNVGGDPNSKTELLDPDSVQEVRVETSNSGAQFATPATAIVSTKSGTNKLHGTLFETARNNSFGVARQRQDAAGVPAPELIRNEFGASAGGPVVLPRLYNGRDKTFWFFAYERYSLAQQSSSLIAVPTMAMRQGNFSGLINKAGVLQTIFDPSTTKSQTVCPYLVTVNAKSKANPFCRTPFPNNTIPQNEESPLAKLYYQLVPQPTTQDDPLVNGNYTGTAPVYQVVPQQTARVDHIFNQNNRAYIRFTHQATGVNITGGPENIAVAGIPAGAALGYNNNPSHSYFAAINFTHIFSPTFFAETILSQQWFGVAKIAGVDPQANYESLLGLPNNFGQPGFPNIASLITALPSSQTNNSTQSQINSLLDENLTKVIGRHQILFGGRLTHTRQSNQPNGLADSATFGVNPTAIYDPTTQLNYTGLPNTGYADASFFLGSAATYNVNFQAPRVNYHQWGGALYAQDNFHVNSNLVLNLGVRYEAHPALYTENGLMNSFDLKNDAVVLASTPEQLVAKGYTTQSIIDNDRYLGIQFETAQQAGMPANTLLNSYYWNFLPRLGFAWTVNGSQRSPVIRAGYGIYLYDTPLENFANHPENNNPLTATYTQSYASAAQSIDGFQNELLRYNTPVKFPVAGANSSGVVNTSSTTAILPGAPTAFWSDSPDWRPTHVQQANITIEQPLPGRSALRVSWIYSESTDLDIAEAYNNAPTQFQWEAATGTIPPKGGLSVIGTSAQNTYAAVATNPYDNRTYGGNTYHTKDGFANYNAIQVNYQRLYHRGSAFQLSYVYAKAFRAGGDNGNNNTDSTVYPDANYPGVIGSNGVVSFVDGPAFQGAPPPPRPANLPVWATWHDMIQYQLYRTDPTSPKLHLKFNGIYDIPVGRNKQLFSNTSRWLNEIIGGFQLAGTLSIQSQVFQPSAANFGPVSPIQIYKHKYPITDCTSGTCRKEYLWYNGYISPLVNANTGCTSNCISGLPGSYQPYQTPIDNTPGTADFNSDKVAVKLLDGTAPTIGYDTGPNASNYTSKTFLNGPINWTADASIFKVFPVREGMFLRVNLDAFNVFNMPGENNPDVLQGIERYLNSANPARQLQITARFTF